MALPTNIAPELRALPPEALAELRALNEANLPHLCDAYVDTKAGARVGGALVAVQTPLLAAVPCRLVAQKRLPSEEMLIGDQPYAGEQWNLVFRVGIILPEGAVATVVGVDALGTAWTRIVRIGTPLHSRAFETESRYGARDVGIAGR